MTSRENATLEISLSPLPKSRLQLLVEGSPLNVIATPHGFISLGTEDGTVVLRPGSRARFTVFPKGTCVTVDAEDDRLRIGIEKPNDAALQALDRAQAAYMRGDPPYPAQMCVDSVEHEYRLEMDAGGG